MKNLQRATVLAVLLTLALGALAFLIMPWKYATVATFLIFVGTTVAAESDL